MAFQSAINQAITTIGSMSAIGRHLKQQSEANKAAKAEYASQAEWRDQFTKKFLNVQGEKVPYYQSPSGEKVIEESGAVKLANVEGKRQFYEGYEAGRQTEKESTMGRHMQRFNKLYGVQDPMMEYWSKRGGKNGSKTSR